VYRTDLATMVGILFQQSVELHAQVSWVDGIEGPCLVRVLVVKGNIAACSIEKSGEDIASSDAALRIVERLGTLEWTYAPLEKGQLALMTPQAVARLINPTTEILPSSIPVRVCLVGQHERNTWPRTQRLVFNLIDGNKSAERIAQLLSKPYEMVEKILYSLRAKDVIALSSRPLNDSHSAETRALQLIFEKQTKGA